ncbi:MAG: hypothetical protein JAZ19_21220 [Candidatus Thiodiazotropha taylori]|uniref:Uncharacterized protein n=1 Tax=Candidatus Thiodiazotropha taylori TaxID=2792791 RepID=A0A9E4N637_9GAMM|nr:hypothetical protein [Candidatus Thiodiazotropha taylori]MCG8039545.1 hypothetical protein [Candidatus Thiodiazotropha taylori]MCW4258312.1 hypothetical protein [Candidatus Thiodiazotropha taylori]RLW71579.1 MAG: hypothetical protein B6D71_01390 [gamma proteobacterium symbiont of Stewartia floridana]
MEGKRLYKFESKTADILLSLWLSLLVILFATSLLLSDYFYALLIGCLFLGYIIWRLYKGPLLGEPLLIIDSHTISFKDRAFTGEKKFRIKDVRLLSLVGSTGNRKIRIHTRSGEEEIVYQAIRGKQLVRMVEFLKLNLPQEIVLREEESALWFDSVRGDF